MSDMNEEYYEFQRQLDGQLYNSILLNYAKDDWTEQRLLWCEEEQQLYNYPDYLDHTYDLVRDSLIQD
jgi:hypothetical protein